MTTIKDFRYRVDASTLPRRRVRLTCDGRPALEAATPPEFRGGTPGIWTPEDLLAAAVASCYALTLEAIGDRRQLGLRQVDVSAVAHVTRRAEGRLGFVVIELRVNVTVEAGHEAAAEHAAHDAHHACLVTHALDVPVELELTVRSDDGVARGQSVAARTERTSSR
ncbi:MAG TPA: OsmC family protein [Gaiellaceae bacterium]|jgi:organic hydroperoxide reductase OsmC/OhrA|nr:OsmC family protein [Gaiellaceae bacterium]